MDNTFESIRKYDQLEKLLEAGADPGTVEDKELAECLEVAALLSAAEEPVGMPRSVEFRKQVVRRIEKRRSSYWQGGFLAVAAAVIAFFIFPERPGDPTSQSSLSIDPQVLERAIQNEARSAMIEYLEETEQLLVSIRDFEVSCSEEKTNIGLEKKAARELLLKQKHFEPQFNTPEFLQARTLFDQLEKILSGVNGLDPCTDPMEIDMINEHVSKRRIISKLRHMAQSIQA